MLSTDLLCYNSATGNVAFFASDGSNTLIEPAALATTWETNLIIVPGKFIARQPGSTTQGTYADLLIYSPNTQQAQFYSTDGTGNRTAVGPPILFPVNKWSHIIAGIFTPDGPYTDLLFYDQSAGEGQFYSTDGQGGLNQLVSYPFVHWTHIVSGFFRPNAQTMDLLFYDAPTGKAEFYSVWYGNITLMQSYSTASGNPWLTTWTQIVPGTFRVDGDTDDLLLYDPSLNTASFLSTDGQGGIATIRDYTDWISDWTDIVSGYFLRDMTCSSLVIYSRSLNLEAIMFIGGQANEGPRGNIVEFGDWTDIIPAKFLRTELEVWRNFDEQSLTRVEGYASLDSVAPGHTIDFCLEAEQIYRGRYFFDFSIRIDRCGVADFTYQSYGTARPQETPADASSSGCNWSTSTSVSIPTDCRSGVYYATVTAGTMSTQIPFVVRPAAPKSGILLEIAFATMQAYNMWGGHSVYAGIPPGSARVPVVSFDRPFSVDSNPAILAALPGFIFNRYGILSSDFIQWLEVTNELQIDYCTSLDLHFGRTELLLYKLLISHWHDEYWSFEMRSNVESFLADGGNVAFLAGNTCWWQIRFDDTGRLLTCYKYVGEPDGDQANASATNDPNAASPDPNIVKRSTIYWWDDRVNWPELSMTGLTFRYGWSVARTYPNFPPRGYTVAQPDSWVFAGTGLSQGSIFGQESGIIGGEVDSALGTYPDGTKFGNIYWSLAYPNSPAGLVELAYCDLYQVPGWAGTSLPVMIVIVNGNTITVTIPPTSPSSGLIPSVNQYLYQGGLIYRISAVIQDGNNFVLTVSEPAIGLALGTNIVFGPTGWASMGLFQYSVDNPGSGWVFNAGTISWTSGLDPSNATAVSKITLNVLRRLGGAPV